MYICICNAISDKDIRRAAEAGATDLWALQSELGVAANVLVTDRVANADIHQSIT